MAVAVRQPHPAGRGTRWRGFAGALAVAVAALGMAFVPQFVDAKVRLKTSVVRPGDEYVLQVPQGEARVDPSPMGGWERVPTASRSELELRQSAAMVKLWLLAEVRDTSVAFDRELRSLSWQDGWKGGGRGLPYRSGRGLDGLDGTFGMEGERGVLIVAGRDGTAVAARLTAPGDQFPGAEAALRKLMDLVEVGR